MCDKERRSNIEEQKEEERKDSTASTASLFKGMTILDMEINAAGLAALIHNSLETTVIVDCRGFSEFNQLHVKHSVNAFFSKLMRRRLFENKVDNECLVHHLLGAAGDRSCKIMDVVLYADEDKTRVIQKRRINSCNSHECNAKMLRLLRDRLEETNQFRGIMILEGGFNKFRTAYPSLCESTTASSGGGVAQEHSGLVAPNSAMPRLSTSLSQPCLAERSEGPTMIFPFLYLGSQRDSLDDTELKRCGITDVINLSTSLPRSSYIVNDENFLRIPVNDNYQEKLSPHFESAFEHLERIRMTGRVCLIHCLAGISRSPTLAISYVMRHKKLSSDEAYKYVKEKRPSISPNFNFMGQLLEYEEKLIKMNILKPESSSKRASDKPLSLLQDVGQDLLCPAKVPKSASSHCVFSSSESSHTLSSQHLNENGKRSLLLNSAGSSELSSTQSLNSTMDRPRALLLPLSLSRRPKELSSPSTEMSKLSFTPTEMESPQAVMLTNPCFFSPSSQSKPLPGTACCQTASHILPSPDKACSCLSNPCFNSAPSTPSGDLPSSRTSCINKLTGLFKKNPAMRLRMPSSPLAEGHQSAARPDCLRSSGVVMGSGAEPKRHNNSKIKTTPLSTTHEEPDAESPESGFQDGGYKSTPETDPDRASIGSASSIEIAVK